MSVRGRERKLDFDVPPSVTGTSRNEITAKSLHLKEKLSNQRLCRDGQCELSDIEQRDLRLGYDYLQDKEFWMFTWDFGTPSCYYPPQPGNPPLLNDLTAYGQ